MATSYAPVKVSAFTDVNKRVRVWDITCSGTYATGGDSITAATLGMKKIEEFIIHGNASDGTLLYTVQPVYASNGQSVTLKFFETGAANAGSAEKGNTESMASITFRVTVRGF